MRLLDRYLLRELLVPFTYCLVGFLVFWVSCDLFAELSSFQKLALTGVDVLTYYAVKTPEMLVMILPIVFLLALLYALTTHARHYELMAVRSAGVSLARMSAPYLAVGLVLCLGVFAMNELWVPRSLEAAAEILTSRKAGRVKSTGQQGDWVKKLGFHNAPARRQWFMDGYNLVTSEMLRPHISWELPDGTRRVVVAERGKRIDGVWTFFKVHEMVHTPSQLVPVEVVRETLAMPEFTETPEQIRSEIKISRLNLGSFKSVRRVQLSIREILDYRRLHPEGTDKDAILATKLHGRLATPWTSLVVVLIALPFGVASGRRNVFVGVASSILICFGYFVLMQLALALGTGGYLPPWVAAWAPNAFFSALGLVLTYRVR